MQVPIENRWIYNKTEPCDPNQYGRRMKVIIKEFFVPSAVWGGGYVKKNILKYKVKIFCYK